MKKNYIKKSFKFFKNVKYKLLLLTAMNVVVGALGFFVPIIVAKLITEITNLDATKVLSYATLLLVLYVGIELIWMLIRGYWYNNIRSKILFNIRRELVNNILELKTANFDKNSTGMFQERIKGDPQNIARVVNAGQRYLIDIISKVGVIVYVLYINYTLGLIYISGVIIVTLIDIYAQDKSKQKNKIARKSDEKLSSVVSEVIRGIRDIKLLNFKTSIKSFMEKQLNDNNEYILDKDMYDMKIEKVENIVLYLTLFLVVIIGIKYVNAGLITSSALITLYLYNNDIFSLMGNVSKLRSCVKEYELAIQRIFDLCDDEKFPKDKYGNITIDDFKGKIEFMDVEFQYSENKEVLKNLSFTIDSKTTVALVGTSGSGKTTILNLIARSYDVNKGTIKLDNVDIKELEEGTLRKNISVITQSPYIFNMSIKDNLRLVKPNATDEEIDKVCKKACFYDYVQSLPDKYNTILGEGGVNLSGGQRQRLAIARALLKECKIMLFDEATSALDNETQKEIQKSIDNLSKEYTIIIVAHRLSTIKNCEMIYLLNHGKIIDKGTHEQLFNRNKIYHNLYNAES